MAGRLSCTRHSRTCRVRLAWHKHGRTGIHAPDPEDRGCLRSCICRCHQYFRLRSSGMLYILMGIFCLEFVSLVLFGGPCDKNILARLFLRHLQGIRSHRDGDSNSSEISGQRGGEPEPLARSGYGHLSSESARRRLVHETRSKAFVISVPS